MRAEGPGRAHAPPDRSMTSRRTSIALLLVLVALPSITSAQSPERPTSVMADSAQAIVPGRAILRSAVMPGWGQFYVGRPFKGVLLGAGALYTVGMTVRAHGRVGDLAGLRTGLADPLLDDRIESWRAERRRWSLWIAGVWIYAMLDAFVDAHLHDFDAVEPDFKPPEAMLIAGSATPLYVGLRFPLGRSRR